MTVRALTAVLISTAAFAALAQQLYRWTDEKGRVHITDTLYTSPGCKGPCDAARALLNKRAVPFREVQVWDEPSNEELKRVSGANDVPTLVVGRSVETSADFSCGAAGPGGP